MSVGGDSAWDPVQYGRFAALRSRPFWDLVELVGPLPPACDVADLGCGSGELTAALAARLGAASTVGVDSSPSMLAAAEAHVSPRVRFEAGDIAAWPGGDDRGGFDLVVANASLQWVPDHEDVLPRWVSALRPGGWLAVQVPANGDHDSHLASVAVADREPFRSAMGEAPPPDPVTANVLPPERYSALLHELGMVDQHVRLQVYPQEMESTEAVVEWVRGTSLTRFMRVMPDDLHAPFLDAYRTELLARLGERSPYLYTFKRILFGARRPS